MNIKKRMFLSISMTTPTLCLPFALIACSNNEKPNSQPPEKSDPKKPTKSKKFSKLLILGDSLSDQGSLIGIANEVLPQYKKAKFASGMEKQIVSQLTNKISLQKPYFQNRSFSNGKVAAEILAQKMGLTNSPAWSITDFKTSGGTIIETSKQGTNFAIAKAVVAPQTVKDSEISDPLEKIKNQIENKIDQLIDLDSQTHALIKQYKSLDSELIYLNIGHNDLIAMSQKYINDSTKITKHIDLMIKTIENNVNQLIKIGAKDIIMSNAIDISKLPLFANEKDKQKISNMVKQYNDKLAKLIVKINNSQAIKNKKHQIIKQQDLYNQFDALENEFKKSKDNHFTNATNITSGITEIAMTGEITLDYTNGANENNLDHFFFLDPVHPTEFIQNKFAEKIYELVVEKNHENN